MSERFNILSLSGGGFLGLYTAAVLAALENDSGPPIARRFDLLAGTSIGGIIALGVAAEIPAATMRDAIERNGTRIFSDRPAPTSLTGSIYDMLRYIRRPKYQAEALRQVLVELFDDTRMVDLKQRILLPSVNLTKGRPQDIKTHHHKTTKNDQQIMP